MDSTTFHNYYDAAVQALEEQRLGDSLQALNNLLVLQPSAHLQSKLQEITYGYQYLLDYMLKGQSDPERIKMFLSFISKTYDVADDVFRQYDLNTSSHFATTAAVIRNMQQGKSLSSVLSQHPSYQTLFETVWTSAKWDAEDTKAAQNYMMNEEVDENSKCLFVSAATMGLLHHFDAAKFRFLGIHMEHTSVMTAVRSIVGYILAACHYQKRMYLCHDIQLLGLNIFSSPTRAEMLRDVQAQFFMLNESDSIAKRMRDEIMPQMMEKIKKYQQKGLFNAESVNEALMEQNLDPALFVDDDLGKQIRQLITRQSQGADLYLNTFSMMKHNLPFFNTMVNWFFPFTAEHPDIKRTYNAQFFSIINTLAQSNPLCDSDRYSFYFALVGLTDNMLSSFGPLYEQMKQMQEKDDEAGATAEKDERKNPMLQLRFYMQDIFRFFKYSRFHEDRISPFKGPINLFEMLPFDESMLSREDIDYLCEFAFATKSYEAAISFYNMVEKKTSVHWQKMGYCHQLLNDYDNAVACYRKAALSDTPSQWMLRQMAFCHRHLLKWDDALSDYRQLVALDAENIKYLLGEAECHVMLQQYEDATKLLSKVYYLDEDNLTAVRALAWCKLLLHKPNEASTLYQKLLHTPASIPEDSLNAGHTALVMGNVGEAVRLYRDFLRQTQREQAEPQFFDDDLQVFTEYGVNRQQLKIVRDAVNMNNDAPYGIS